MTSANEMGTTKRTGRAIKVVYYLLGGFVALAGTVFIVAWKSPPYYEVQSRPEARYDLIVPFASYGEISDHANPMIVKGKMFVLFGSMHTRDPKDSQLPMIDDEWNALRPTVALVEGRLGFLFPGFMDPVKTLGEGGKVKELASMDGIDLYNWDLSKETLAIQLRGKFEDDQIALAQILNPYFGMLRFGRPQVPEDVVTEYLGRAGFVGAQDRFRSASDVDTAWKRYFPDGPDWRDVSDERGLPGYLDVMAVATNDLRNEQLVAALSELLAKGERVFVIAGSSHAACVAPALQHETIPEAGIP